MTTVLAVCAVLAAATAQAPGAILTGVVVDARTTAPVAGAQVVLLEPARAALTAADGRFEFRDVPAGARVLTISMIGYAFVRRDVTVAGAPISLRIPLVEGTGAYQEHVTVTAEAAPPPAIGVSSQAVVGSALLQELRGVTTDDPLRAMQTLPGVATGDDFQAEFSVRGAPFRHLGLVVDDSPTTLLIHAVRARENTGSVAMINSDVLESASLLAGPHPARHGDWLGATMAVTLREGSRDRTTLRLAVSGTSASAVVEGPVGRGRKASWLMSIRKSYLDWLVRKIDPGIDSTIGFWDGQLKVVYDATARDRIEVAIVGGEASYREDRVSLPNGMLAAGSGSTVASVAWRAVRGRTVATQRLSFQGGDFDNRGAIAQQLGRGYTQTLVMRSDIAAPLGAHWSFEGGLRGEWSRLNQILREFRLTGPGRVQVRDERDESARWTVASVWSQATYRGPSAAVAIGARVSRRSAGAGTHASPWILADRTLGAWTVRGGASLAAQFLDPTMVTTARDTRPERARLADLSVEHRLTSSLRWQVTAFHRRESDVLRRLDEDRLDDTGARVPAGVFPVYRPSLDGRTSGADLVLSRRAAGGPSGWIAYTWSASRYRDVVSGETFDADFDQRHTVNAFAQQRLSYRLAVSGKLRIGSNVPVVGYFASAGGETLRLASLRNRVRLPRYVRLDVRVNRAFTFERRRLTVFVEVMNALGRENIGQSDGSIRASLEAVGYFERLIPRVPSAGVLFEF